MSHVERFHMGSRNTTPMLAALHDVFIFFKKRRKMLEIETKNETACICSAAYILLTGPIQAVDCRSCVFPVKSYPVEMGFLYLCMQSHKT